MKRYQVTFEFELRDDIPMLHGWVRSNYNFIVGRIRQQLKEMEDELPVAIDNFRTRKK